MSQQASTAQEPHGGSFASRLNWLRAGVLGANDGLVSTAAADELTRQDVLGAHLDIELGIDAEDLASPWAAAASSALAFSVGGTIPLIAILAPPASVRIAVAITAVLLGLLMTGMLSAHLGRSSGVRAAVRLVAGGALAMAVTFGIGRLLGATVS